MIKSLTRSNSSKKDASLSIQLQKKNSKRSSGASKAALANEKHNEVFEVWASTSMTSVASSVTCPPSQTASFYKRALYEFGSDSDDDSDFNANSAEDLSSEFDNTTTRSGDDDLSFAGSRSSSDAGSVDLDDSNSEGAVNVKQKKKQIVRRKLKSKKGKMLRSRIFGGAAIKEGDDGEEEDNDTEAVSTKPRCRLSLFGSSTHGASVSEDNATSDDGCSRSNDESSHDASLGYGDAAPTVQNRRGSMSGGAGKTGRRSSLGGMFSKKPNRRASMTNAEVSEKEQKPDRRQRRNSLLGPASSEHIPKTSDVSDSRRSSMDSKSLHASRRRSSQSTSSKQTASTSSTSHNDIHWLINQERRARKMYLLERSLLLDALAKSMAQEIMSGQAPTPADYYGNVAQGEDLEHIHQTIMLDTKGQSRKNILSQDFHEFGAHVCQGKQKNSPMIMVALFNS